MSITGETVPVVEDGELPIEESSSPSAINGVIQKAPTDLHQSQLTSDTPQHRSPTSLFTRRETHQKKAPTYIPAAFIVNLPAPSTYVGPAA